MQPQRDIDFIKINDLTNNILYKSDIDLKTITDFDLSKESILRGFDDVRDALRRAISEKIEFLPISVTQLLHINSMLSSSKILD